MRIILTFVLNAGLNFVLGLAVAAALGPDLYGRFAVGATVAVVLATGLFEWLRLSTTRFYVESARTAEPGLRATLDASYALIAIALIVAIGVTAAVGLHFGLDGWIVAAAGFLAVTNGYFDFYAALARSRFFDRAYAALVIGKNVLAFAAVLATARLWHDPALTLAALAFATILAVLPLRRALADRGVRFAMVSGRHLTTFARYGFPVIGANVIYQLIILANRSFAASTLGYAAAGHLSLATDLSLRLLLSVGAALDVLLFQLAVRKDAEHGREAAASQLRRNMTFVAAVLALLATGYGAAMPAFDAVLVPARYQATFGSLSLILLPGMLLFSFAQFALNPVFQLAGRTGPITLAALAALATDGVGLAVIPASLGPAGLALVHSIGLGVSFLATALLAWRVRLVVPSGRDLAAVAVASAATLLALWPTRTIAIPWLALATAACLGTLLFSGLLIAFDVGGLRAAALDRMGLKRPSRLRPQAVGQG